MEIEIGQNRMCVCLEGSQDQIQGAIVLEKQEEEEEGEKKKN
jgi:hypothetical protein